MKNLYAVTMLAGALFMSACSKDDGSSDNQEPKGVVFELSAVEQINLAKGPLYSQEAVQTVENVNVYVFQLAGSDYLYLKTFNIPGWTKGSTFNRYEVPTADMVPAGDYKFLAVGRDLNDSFTLTTLTAGTTKYEDMAASVAAAGNEVELFAGTKQVTVSGQGMRVPIQMTRQVAGVLGYFKNVPYNIAGTDVKYLRLTVNNSNKSVNLTTSFGTTPTSASYNIINMDLSGQAKNADGTYAGNDLNAQGVVKVANSQLSGAYVIPVNNVTLTLGLYDTSGNVLKTWSVVDNTQSTFNILANHFYSLGTKTQTGNTTGTGTGGGGGTPTPDAPIDLFKDQSISITITPDWTLIHNLVIQ